MFKKSFPGLVMLLGFFMLASFFITGCNNEGEKKGTPTDSTTKTELAPPPAPVIDTTDMDSASTRPVKTPD
jgi:hypothetical protein